MPQLLSSKNLLLATRPLTVGVISDSTVLRQVVADSATELQSACDLVEIRLDLLAGELAETRQLAGELTVPILFTARHPAEGGQGPEDHAARAAMYEAVLDLAALIDVELQSAPHMAGLLKQARERGVGVVGSFHDFQATPADDILIGARDFAQTLGLDAVKLATYLNSADDLHRLMKQVTDKRRLPLSAMGMGPLGRLSRLVLAKFGSLLNYGYLGQSNAPGQWPAPRLKDILAEL
jgi:3-dehydroquinate dehydratase I